MQSPFYLAGVTNCVVGALGRGDLRLFDRILGDLRRYPEVNCHPQAQLGREITEAWIRQFLRVPKGYPEWMVRMNLTQIPEEWKRLCAYLGVKGMLVRKDYASAYATATLLLNFDRMKNALSASMARPTSAIMSGSFAEGLSDKCELSIHTISIDL